jgi:uncharacterized protein
MNKNKIQIILIFLTLFQILSFNFNQALAESDIKALELGCSQKKGDDCYQLGNLHFEGKGIEQDYFKAKEYYEKSCDLKNGVGCFLLAQSYNLGKGVEQDYFKAREYNEKSCDLKFALG